MMPALHITSLTGQIFPVREICRLGRKRGIEVIVNGAHAYAAAHLWERRRIIATPIVHEEFQGLRVTPNVYTTLAEVDAFVEEMERVIGKGLA